MILMDTCMAALADDIVGMLKCTRNKLTISIASYCLFW